MIFPEIRTAFEADRLSNMNVRSSGEGDLPAWYEVTELAVESFLMAGCELSALAGEAGNPPGPVIIDRRLASLWFDTSLRPIGWDLPPVWDAVAGDYRTKDGWIRLHTNAPHHKTAALRVLNLDDSADRAAVASVAHGWEGDALESAVVAADGCAAVMRSHEAWLNHPQGKAVAGEALVDWSILGRVTPDDTDISPLHPLSGVKILDLTRIIAGPVATRFLAAYGAQVLRIDPPWWDESSNAPEMSLGKRCAALNLDLPPHRKVFENLVCEADLIVHGYRPEALSALGFDTGALHQLNPRLIDIALCAYGWTGPWAGRRGFDSLVQMSSGIAEYGMRSADAEKPQPLPVQALDHATGYLMAAAAIHALNRRREDGRVLSVRFSLARTAELLATSKRDQRHAGLADETSADFHPDREDTAWGQATRLKFPLDIPGLAPVWPCPAGPFRSSAPTWGETS